MGTEIIPRDFKDFLKLLNKNRKFARIDGIKINIISLAGDLKRNNKASGRHKDLNDLKNLP